MTEPTQPTSDTRFMKVFIPGLIVGLLVGMAIGAFVPPLLDRGPRLPTAPPSGYQPTGNRDARDDRATMPPAEVTPPAPQPIDPTKPTVDPKMPPPGEKPVPVPPAQPPAQPTGDRPGR